MESAGGIWVEYDIGHATLAIGCYGDAWKPSPDGTRIALQFQDLDDEIAQLQVRNVQFAMGATDTPICRFAILCDPDGNRIMLHQRKAL